MTDLITTGPLDILTIIALSGLAESTKDKYRRAVQGYLATDQSLTDAPAMAAYAATVSASVAGNLKSALKLWSRLVELQLKSAVTPDTVHAVQAAIWRLEAMGSAISAPAPKGEKLHAWLSSAQVLRLQTTCDPANLHGRRDRAILATLVGSGLRREEMAALDFADRALVSSRGKFRTVLNVTGKGAKDRVIPISEALASRLDEWRTEAGPGRIGRAIDNRGELRPSISAMGIFRVVSEGGRRIGRPELAPHDLRRSYAQIGFEAGVSIVQLSRLLGHASVATTQRYLNLELDLAVSASDFIPIG